LFQSFRSYIKVFDPLWIGFSIGWEIGIYFQSSAGRYPVFLAPFVEGAIFSPVCFWHFCQKSVGCNYVGLFPGLLIYWFTCLFLCKYYAVFVTMAVSIIWSQVLWYLQHCSFCSWLLWLFQGYFCFYMNFRTDFSTSEKNVIGILMGITLGI
jgi:hypothetical protein